MVTKNKHVLASSKIAVNMFGGGGVVEEWVKFLSDPPLLFGNKITSISSNATNNNSHYFAHS